MLVSLATSLRAGTGSVDGRATSLDAEPMRSGEPDGHANRYSTTLTVPAGGTVVLEVHLTGRARSTHSYSLTLVHQPLANDDRVRVVVRFGRTSSSPTTGTFTLTESRVIRLARA